jgi:hypothetical protein
MKVTRESNYRLTVFPVQGHMKRPLNDQNEMDTQTLSSIASGIKRHVDDVSEVHTEHDTEEVCSLCEHRWETNNIGMPLCCDEAVEEWRKDNAEGIIYKVSESSRDTRIYYILSSKPIPEGKVQEMAMEYNSHDDIDYGDDAQVNVEVLGVEDV